METMLETVLTFVREQWVIVLVALVAVFVVINIFKNVFRWIILLAIGAALVAFVINYDDGKLLEQGKQLAEQAAEQAIDFTAEQAVAALVNDVANAKYQLLPDGNYTVEAGDLTLTGKVDSDQAKIQYMGQTFEVQLTDRIRQVIEQARANSQ